MADGNAERNWAAVYVIAANNGEIKIGFSRYPVSRFTDIKREYAKKRGFTDARLVGYIEASRSDVLEALSHRYFWGSWISGEWFDVDPGSALAEIEWLWGQIVAEYGEPPCRVVRFEDLVVT